MNQVIVIGAGASGMMAAITAAQNGAKVTLLEKMEKPGKKLLITGNGRCNITNSEYERPDCYRSDEIDSVKHALSLFSYEDTLRFFEQIGLLLHEKNGYYYPVTNQASSVLDILMQTMQRLSVKLKYNEKVVSIKKEDGKWRVDTEGWHYIGDKVIIAVGSKAAPVTGADENGYRLLSHLGFKIVEPFEALVPLKCKQNWIRKLAGVRMAANLCLLVKDSENQITEYHDKGEIQWTEYGISGIAVFQLSRYAVHALNNGKIVVLQLDLVPTMDKDALREFLEKQLSLRKTDDVLSGILPKKMIPIVTEQIKNGKLKNSTISELSDKLATILKVFEIQIIGSKSFEMAQVCAGGVSLKEIDPDSMQSKQYPGLYLTGEILDVDGICGGYNLQWAWTSGYLAGKHASK